MFVCLFALLFCMRFCVAGLFFVWFSNASGRLNWDASNRL